MKIPEWFTPWNNDPNHRTIYRFDDIEYFVSYFRRTVCDSDPELETDSIVEDLLAASLVAIKTGKDAEILDSLLPKGFLSNYKPNYHDEAVIRTFKQAIIDSNPALITRVDAYRLAHLSIALMNYDALHVHDKSPILIRPGLRSHATHLVKIVDEALTERIMPVNRILLDAKYASQR